MTIFNKENWDVSQIFLAYLTFLGNSTKVATALKVPQQVVEVLAQKEDWPAKLKTFVALRNPKRLTDRDREIRRTVTYIMACHLRDIIQRLINYAQRMVKTDNLVDMFSVRCRRTGRPKFSVKTLVDLARAYHLATRVIAREISVEEKPEEEPLTEKERLRIDQAISKAMQAVDTVRGLDSVALANKSLSKWQTGDPAH